MASDASVQGAAGSDKEGRKTSALVNFVEACEEVVTDVFSYWWSHGFDTVAPAFLRKRRLLQKLEDSTTYSEWRETALALDLLCENDVWKRRIDHGDYDFNLVRDCLDDLYRIRKNNDPRKALFLLRSTIHRNLGNMCAESLYTHCFTGLRCFVVVVVCLFVSGQSSRVTNSSPQGPRT